MPRPTSLSSVLACTAFLFLTQTANAQLRSGAMAPLPGVPMTAPPVDHPALVAQPLFNESTSRPAPASPPAKPASMPAKPATDPAAAGPKVAGKDLKKAVVAVKKTLTWYDKLPEARAQSAATGKPILWVQALGDIEGFA